MTSGSGEPSPIQSEAEELRFFVSAITDFAIFMLSPTGHVMTWNAGAERFKGYRADEVIGQHFSRFYTAEERARGLPVRALETALRDGRAEMEGWRVRKDGRVFWAAVVIECVRDTTGSHIGFAKITRDIEDRRKAELSLRASEEKFRLLVQGVTDYAIFMLTPDGTVSSWNTGAQRIKGFSQDEIVGSHFSRFYTEEDRAAGLPARVLEEAAKEGRFESEGWRVRKDGSRFWAHVVVDAIHGSTGELIGFGKVTRDMTERRGAAEAPERAKEALFQAQKLEAVGKLTGGVAHDFNNILSVVVSGLDVVSKEVQSPSDLNAVGAMQRAASRGATLIQQLLAFARQRSLRKERTNLSQLIASFEAMVHRACADEVSLNFRLDPSVWPTSVDRVQFQAALLSLVDNANDATNGAGTISISVENVVLPPHKVNSLAEGGRYVRLSVRDSGTGMTPEVASQAIEPFFTTKPLGEGTGLGLSQVYGLVQQSGGGMEIETQVGKGTTVSLYWPADGVQDDSTVTSLEESPAVEKALVVDDQPEVLESVVELFKVMGYQVLSAGSGKDALEILMREPDIGISFTDVVMPGMSGVELGREARALKPGVKIVLCSGYPREPWDNGRTATGEFRFLRKPFRMAEIVEAVREAE